MVFMNQMTSKMNEISSNNFFSKKCIDFQEWKNGTMLVKIDSNGSNLNDFFIKIISNCRSYSLAVNHKAVRQCRGKI